MPSIGGGVCQAATTVFDAAFFGGYEISHRSNHSFYISHYPLGLDATVADSGPDFTFVNDTENAIVIKASANPETMTVAFLSRPLNRKVDGDVGADRIRESQEALLCEPGRAGRARSRRRRSARRASSSRSRARCVASDGKVLHEDSFPLALHRRGRDLPDRQGRQAARRAEALGPLSGLHRLDGRHRPRQAGSRRRSRRRRIRPPTARRCRTARCPAPAARPGPTDTTTDGHDGRAESRGRRRPTARRPPGRRARPAPTC